MAVGLLQVMVRPSYVLGGRAMEIVYSDNDLKRYIENAVEVPLALPALHRSMACDSPALPIDQKAGCASFAVDLVRSRT